jgi:hypothetical protein
MNPRQRILLAKRLVLVLIFGVSAVAGRAQSTRFIEIHLNEHIDPLGTLSYSMQPRVTNTPSTRMERLVSPTGQVFTGPVNRIPFASFDDLMAASTGVWNLYSTPTGAVEDEVHYQFSIVPFERSKIVVAPPEIFTPAHLARVRSPFEIVFDPPTDLISQGVSSTFGTDFTLIQPNRYRVTFIESLATLVNGRIMFGLATRQSIHEQVDGPTAITPPMPSFNVAVDLFYQQLTEREFLTVPEPGSIALALCIILPIYRLRRNAVLHRRVARETGVRIEV